MVGDTSLKLGGGHRIRVGLSRQASPNYRSMRRIFNTTITIESLEIGKTAWNKRCFPPFETLKILDMREATG